MNIVNIPTQNYFANRQGQPPRWLIIHGTAGGTSAEAIAHFFQGTENGNNPVSSNYIIGTDGEVVMAVGEGNGAWANGPVTGPAGTSGDGVGNGYHDAWWDNIGGANPNNVTISIELCKPSNDNSDHITPAQQQSCFQLIKEICGRQGIPARKADAQGGITGHYSLDPVNRQRCPGPFPWDELWDYLGGDSGVSEMLNISDPFATAHFIEKTPNLWHCKETNIDVHDAILDYYRACNGAFRLPKTSEIYGVIPGCSYQVFEAGVIIYDPAGKFDKPGPSPCYAMRLDQNTPGLQNLMHMAGVTVPVQPPAMNFDGTASTLHGLISAADSIKAGVQNVLADIGKA